jgi:integrase/recombinase XerD
MTLIAPTLQAFFTDRLITERNASPATIASYRDTMRLLLGYAHDHTGKAPHELDVDDLDAPLVAAFLSHLETGRGNSARTRNNRLAAIHSLYRYAALRHPEHAYTIARVIAIPTKRYHRDDICYLDLAEIKALLAAPDTSRWLGRRDHALLLTMVQTGVRVAELTALRLRDVNLATTAAHVRISGKGRKLRAVTLTHETAGVLRDWLRERQGQAEDPLFPTRQGGALSRDAVAWLIAKHARTASTGCPSLSAKHVTPHVLRHTNAMLLKANGVDIATIALWLGHESITTTHIYQHADPALKEAAIARIAPLGTKPGRYRPPDQLLAFLEAL